MNKLFLALALWVGMVGAGWALTVEQQLLASLQAQGYVILEQGYTFLGRLRILAQNDDFRREIVVNPGTGEILRDYAVMLPKVAMSGSGPVQGPGGAGSTVSATSASIGSGVVTSVAGSDLAQDDADTMSTTALDPRQSLDDSGILQTLGGGFDEGAGAPEIILIDPLLPFAAEEP